MNAIFTICAKNYMAHAKTLGDSVKHFHPECDFYILLSDEIDSYDLDCSYRIIQSQNIGIENIEKMAFQYDVIEFSTSIKPYFIKKLFDDGYDKVLYIDPDMVVYSSLDFLFEYLNKYDAILTPHLLKPYVNYEGATSEEELLFVGIYNLGFFGVKNSPVGNHIAEWWMQKLANQCYADKEDALHVDQKWMDFLPSLYTDEILILRHPGVNLAFWNFHERVLEKTADYRVDKEKLVILHYSGLDPYIVENVCKKQTKYTLTTIPEYRELFEGYVSNLKLNGLDRLSVLPYKYNVYENGNYILKYHRRLFRELSKNNNYINPFSVDKGSFYQLMENNGLLFHDNVGEYAALRRKFNNHESTFKKVYLMLRILKKIIGIKRYYLFIRFMAIHSRFEKQTFLVRK